MDKSLKKKWIAKLRSGDIKQGRGYLCNSRGNMCCLGVLGHVQGLSNKELKRDSIFEEITLPTGYNAGLRKSTREKLARMNDGLLKDEIVSIDQKVIPGKSFLEIADWIEENL